jgi:hypothetical protein
MGENNGRENPESQEIHESGTFLRGALARKAGSSVSQALVRRLERS